MNLPVVEASVFSALSIVLGMGIMFAKKVGFPSTAIICFPFGSFIGAAAAYVLSDPSVVSADILVAISVASLLLGIWFLGRGFLHLMNNVRGMHVSEGPLMSLVSMATAPIAWIVCARLVFAAAAPLSEEERVISIVLLGILYMVLGLILLLTAVHISNMIHMRLLARQRRTDLPNNM
jgi:hypothetical protein